MTNTTRCGGHIAEIMASMEDEMGIGPQPGLTVKVKCTTNTGHVATLSNDDISISVAGSEETVGYFKVDKDYVSHFRSADDSDDNGSDSQAAPS